MGLLTQLRFGLARTLLKTSQFSVVPSWITESFLTPTFLTLVREGYQRNAAFFACVSAHAFAFPEPPLAIRESDADDAKIIPNHPARKLIAKPNPIMGEAELMVATIVYMSIGGNAYWHKVRNRSGQVIELWPYHYGHIQPKPGGGNWIEHYYFDDGTGVKKPIPAEDIVHFKWPSPDPTQPWQAQPPLLAAGRETDSDNEVTRYLYALLKNDAVPRTVVTVDKDRYLNDDEVRRLKEQWTERYGNHNLGSVAILEGGSTVNRLSLNLAELAFDALHRIPETRIAAVLRVPAIIAGLNAGLERATYANYKEARLAYTEDTLVPLWRIVESEITADLVNEFDQSAAAWFNRGRVNALDEDNDARWTRIIGGWEKGLLKRNEGRRALGYSEEPGGDVYFQDIQPKVAAVPPKLLELQSRLAGALPAPEIKAVGPQPSFVQQIEDAMVDYLVDQYQTAIEGVLDQGKASRKAPDDLIDELGLDDGKQVEKLFRKLYPPLLRQAYGDAAAALEVSITFSLTNPRVADTLGELATLVTRVADTTRDQIRELVGKHTTEGWTIDRLADEIARLSEIETPLRARTIAITESASAYSRGSILAWADSGVVEGKEWLAVRESCPICKGLNGERVALKDNFPGGYPCPPAHPSCTCAIAPVLAL